MHGRFLESAETGDHRRFRVAPYFEASRALILVDGTPDARRQAGNRNPKHARLDRLTSLFFEAIIDRPPTGQCARFRVEQYVARIQLAGELLAPIAAPLHVDAHIQRGLQSSGHAAHLGFSRFASAIQLRDTLFQVVVDAAPRGGVAARLSRSGRRHGRYGRARTRPVGVGDGSIGSDAAIQGSRVASTGEHRKDRQAQTDPRMTHSSARLYPLRFSFVRVTHFDLRRHSSLSFGMPTTRPLLAALMQATHLATGPGARTPFASLASVFSATRLLRMRRAFGQSKCGSIGRLIPPIGRSAREFPSRMPRQRESAKLDRSVPRCVHGADTKSTARSTATALERRGRDPPLQHP